ncbi:MAG TPA: hypothetical protein VE621_19030, partial [Bryobacteraceae bacterium]|nr:hypothetical protein [Bryobacteraceae bacterium]
MAETGAIIAFLNKVRRRRLFMLVLDQAAIAVTAGLLGAMVLLVTGTQFLDWWWPALLVLGSFSFGVARLRGRVPSIYQIAQQTDERLRLHDALSTAWHFREASQPPAEVQRSQTLRIVSGLSPVMAAPYSTPRSVYYCTAGILATTILFGVRYGLTKNLSLQKPIANIQWNSINPRFDGEKLASRKSVIQERLDEQLAQMGMALEKVDSPPGNMEEITDKAMPAMATP